MKMLDLFKRSQFKKMLITSKNIKMKKIIILSVILLASVLTTVNAKTHVKTRKTKAELQNCYGGASTCGSSYMFCTDGTLTSAQRLSIWDAFECEYCGE
jgi:hypothetical protein